MPTADITLEQASVMTVPELFERRVNESPDALAVRSVQADLSFGQWGTQAAALSQLLTDQLGELRGERLALWMTNDEATTYVSALQAVFNVGAISVSLDDRFTVAEAARVFAECEPAALIIGPQVAKRLGQNGLDMLDAGGWDAKAEEWNAAIVSLPRNGAVIAATLWRADPDNSASWDQCIARPDDDALIAYTSGSTGTPKGAVWTQSAICQYAERVVNATYALPRGGKSLCATDVLQSPIPLYTAASLIENVYPTVFSGCTLVFEGRRFDADQSEQRMAAFGTTVYNGVPPHLAKMCELQQAHTNASPELMITSGSAITADLYRRVRARWPATIFANWYGLNESGTGQTINFGDDMERHPGSIGRPIPPTRVRVVDPNGNDLETGSEGVLLMQAPGQMREYFRNQEQTAQRFDGDWLITGDRVVIDNDGLIHVVGRNEDRINRGGFKFYPGELEGVLEEHKSVREAAVIAVPHPILGQDAVAFIVRSIDGAQTNEQELRAHCRTRVAPNKIPSQFIFVDGFPRGAYGKVIRRELAALYDQMQASSSTA